MTAARALYAGQSVALLTRHGKEIILRDLLESALGCHLVHTDAWDTDLLGTFTRDIERLGSQRDAAREKTRLAMKLTGATVALASEGAFGLDPFGGIVPWDTELLLWVDSTRGLEIAGWAHGPAQSLTRAIRGREELEGFAADAGFPEHRLTLRPDHEHHPAMRKGLGTWTELWDAFEQCQAESTHAVIFAENDLRGFCNPTRQAIIRRAGEDLVARLGSLCPQCSAPGFWVERAVPGLACRACGRPTRQSRGEIWRCGTCEHREERLAPSRGLADPAHCDACNP